MGSSPPSTTSRSPPTPGRVTGFLGPNGAGKSTTMRVIVGLTPATSGTATCADAASPSCPTPGRRSVSCSTPPPSTPVGPGARSSPLAQRIMGLPARRVDEMLDVVSLTAGRSRPTRARLLPRHAPAARDRRSPDRRSRGAHPRRARQRARPSGHPLDARPAARIRQRRSHGAALLAPAPRDRGHRRRPRRHRQRPHRRPGHQGRAARLSRHSRSGPPRSPCSARRSLSPASTTTRATASRATAHCGSRPTRPSSASWPSRPGRRSSSCAQLKAPASRRCSSSSPRTPQDHHAHEHAGK